MTKKNRARIVTLGLLAAVAALMVWRQSGAKFPRAFRNPTSVARGTPQPDQPRDAIYRILDAAREGDVAAYIAGHTGPMSRRLEQSRDEMTPQGFAEYLRKRNREIKGIAILEPQLAASNRARLDVEYVYADRKEAQRFYLVRLDGVWRIDGVDAAARVATPVPYGTPVY